MRDEDADWCYDTAFNAHAAWFGTPDGRRFLDDVRREVAAIFLHRLLQLRVQPGDAHRNAHAFALQIAESTDTAGLVRDDAANLTLVHHRTRRERRFALLVEQQLVEPHQGDVHFA